MVAVPNLTKMQERRFAPRWQFEESLYYKVLEKEKDFSTGFLKDINLLAAKVYLKTPVAVQTKIKLLIEIPNQPTPIITEGEVIWQNPSIHREFPTGIRFTSFRPPDKEKILSYFQSEIRQNWWR